MVRMRYTGISSHDLDKFRRVVEELRLLRNNCRPLGERYNQVSGLIAGFQRLAHEVTGTRYYYGGDPDKGAPRA